MTFKRAYFTSLNTWIVSIISSCSSTILPEVYILCISNLHREIWQSNRGMSHGDHGNIFSTFTRGLCACTAFKRCRPQVTALSYWLQREFPKLCTAGRGKISHTHQSSCEPRKRDHHVGSLHNKGIFLGRSVVNFIAMQQFNQWYSKGQLRVVTQCELNIFGNFDLCVFELRPRGLCNMG